MASFERTAARIEVQAVNDDGVGAFSDANTFKAIKPDNSIFWDCAHVRLNFG